MVAKLKISIITIAVIIVAMFISCNTKEKETITTIERRVFGDSDLHLEEADSIYTKGDTSWYYKNGELLCTSVTTVIK